MNILPGIFSNQHALSGHALKYALSSYSINRDWVNVCCHWLLKYTKNMILQIQPAQQEPNCRTEFQKYLLIPTIPPCTIFVPIISNINQPLFEISYVPSTCAQTTTTGLGFKDQRNIHSIVPHVSHILFLVLLQQYTRYPKYTRGAEHMSRTCRVDRGCQKPSLLRKMDFPSSHHSVPESKRLTCRSIHNLSLVPPNWVQYAPNDLAIKTAHVPSSYATSSYHTPSVRVLFQV